MGYFSHVESTESHAEANYFTPPCQITRSRGSYATDKDALCPLVNVGGMKTSPSLFNHSPFAKRALRLLAMNPFGSEYAERKLEETPNSERFRSHIRTLEKANVLVPASWEVPHAVGNYMAVLKDQVYARAIFDLRWTNERTIVENIPFHVFGTSELVKALILLGNTAESRIRFLHGDIKNMYYQIPISSALSYACCIRHGGRLLRPTVLPMGYKHACSIAQSIMWAILSYCEPNDVILTGVREINSMIEVQGIVYLPQGGFIALLYDSFLLAATSNMLERWEARLVRNFNVFNLVPKYIKRECNTCSFTFCGIQILQKEGKTYWKVDPSTQSIWFSMSRQLRPNTPRILFQFAGYLRHAHTILGIAPRDLGRIGKLQSDLGSIENWDAKILPDSVSTLVIDKVQQVTYANERTRDSKMFSQPTLHKRVYFAAVDATTIRLAIWPMKNGDVLKDKIEQYLCKMDIILAEATAIANAIRCAHNNGFQFVVIANDNTAACHSFVKGYSPLDTLDHIIKGCECFKGKLVLCDIPSEENIADVGTRPEKVYTESEYN